MDNQKVLHLISQISILQKDLLENDKKESSLYFGHLKSKIEKSKFNFLTRVYLKEILKLGKVPDSVGFTRYQEDLFIEIFKIAKDILGKT